MGLNRNRNGFYSEPFKERARVGFYGGSFNPPHVGHQSTALYAMECANISELIVAPTYIHYDGKQLAPFYDRVKMTAELMDPLRAILPIRVSLIESSIRPVDPQKPGKTIDVINFLRLSQKHPPVYVLVLGSDIKEAFPHWDGHEELEKLTQAGELEIFWVERAGDISSTKVRNLIRSGGNTDRLMPPRIRKIIDQKGLYLV